MMNKNGLSLTNYDGFGDCSSDNGFKQRYIYMPDKPFRMLICGPSGAGKTNLLTNILLKPLTQYDKIYLYAKFLEQSKYEYLRDRLEEVSRIVGYDVMECSNDEVLALDELPSGKCQNKIKTLMRNGEEKEKIIERFEKFEEHWRKFVNIQEEYLELLEDDDERDKARESYKLQIEKKIVLDAELKSFNFNVRETRPKVSSSKRSSSRSSKSSKTISKKLEELALARLKVKQMESVESLELEEFNLRMKRKLLEAKMEEEKAETCVKLYEELAGSETSSVDFQKYLNKNCETRNSCDNGSEGYGNDGSLNEKQISQGNDKLEVDNGKEESGVNHASLVSKEQTFQGNNDVVFIDNCSGNLNANVTLTAASDTLNLTPVLSSTCARATQDVLYTTPNPYSSLPRVYVPTGPNYHPKQQSVYSEQIPVKNSVYFAPNSINQSSFSVPSQIEKNEEKQSWQNSMVTALKQVVSSPKIEYMRFDGNPLRYVTFIHNFETCLEKDNPDESRKLQLLIQHCVRGWRSWLDL